MDDNILDNLKDAKKIDIKNSTVDFFQFEKDGLIYYYFDTSMCTPPHPMVNALVALQLLDSENKRVLMKNHQRPMGLFPKIEENFDYKIISLDDDYLIEFKFITGTVLNTDFDDNQCGG